MELMSTYGWVVFVGVGAMVLLSQMGTFNPTSCSKTSSGFSQVVPSDWSVFVNSNALIIYVQNWAGDPVEVTSVNLSMGSGVQCGVETHVQIDSGSNSSLVLQCSESLADSGKFKPGDCYTGELVLTYTNMRSGNSDVSKGKIRGSIEGMTICYRPSQLCFMDEDCCSGSCKTDYETSDKWCVGDSAQCVHMGIVYDNGANAPECVDSDNRRYCDAGVWNTISCGTDGCSGVCGSSLNGCVWNDVSCSGGSCASMPSDVDSSQASCDSCVGAGHWSVGGEVAATACCGDDLAENHSSRIAGASMDNGYVTSPSDDACCDSALECVDDGACYPSGTTTHDADGDGDNDYCDAGTWKDCQTAAQCGPAAPVCIAGDCAQCTLDEHCGPCQECNSGSCVNQAAGNDKKLDCPGTFGACAADTCNGAGACQYLSGKQSCGTCQQCTGSSYSCSFVSADSDPLGDCTGNCDECNGAGACRADNSRCSGTIGSCSCSGSGTAFNCQSCPDSFGSCGDATCIGYACGNSAYAAGTDCAGLCHSCDGSGSCIDTPNGSDYQGECPGTFGTCAGSNCDGSGACQYVAPGKGSCTACQYCTGASYSCSNVPAGLDTYGECPGVFGSCAADTCSGAGACSYLAPGKQSCGTCQYCTGSDFACTNVLNGVDTYSDCPGTFGACAGDLCNGGAACQILSGKQTCPTCQQCGGASYTCSNVSNGADPNGDCPGAFGTCAADTCNGVAACSYLSPGQQTCGACKYCTGSGFSCSNVGAGTDPYNACAASWTGCSGLCVKTGADGNCGGSGTCNVGGASANVAAGNVCSAGSESSGACNAVWACANAQNTDGAYNNGGPGYWTQGTCDGGGVCDRSGAQGNGDDSSTACSCIKGAGYWGIGGEVSSATCCEDAGEYKKTRSCTSGCTSDGTDDACCNANTDCAYSSTCYSSGDCSGTLKCSSGSWVNHCTNGVQDCDETGVDCGGASCLKPNAQSCTLGTECCSGICSYGVCCSAGQCGWGTPECVADGGFKANIWLNGVCRSGTWKTICGGVGCGTYACDSGTCDNNYCCRLGLLEYRKPVTVTELSGAALTNFPVMITTDTLTLVSGGKMRSDCGDMRFTDNDGTTQLSYWVESGCNTASTVVWVKVPSLAASSARTIYMYYGNAAQTSLSNGNNVFTFFDNFESGSLAAWTITGGTYGTYTAATDQKYSGSYSAKGVDSSASGYPCITRANPLAGASFVNEMRARFGNTLKHFPWSWTSSAGCNTNWLMAYTAQHWMYTLTGCSASNFPTDRTWATNTWYKVKLAYNKNTIKYKTWVDGNYLGEVNAQCGVSPTCVANNVVSVSTMRSCPGTLSENGGIQWIDDFIVRQFATTDPSTSVGSEEAY
jgi:hypothetical protein